MKKIETKITLFLEKTKIFLINNKKDLIISLISVFIIGIIAYGFCLLNPCFSHDGLSSINQLNDNSWKIALGRYIQPLMRNTRGIYSITWLIGIISLSYLSISSFFIIKIFNIKNTVSKILICGILTLNISFSFTILTYVHEADMFALSILLSTLSVYLLNKFKNGFLLGSILVALSMGLYQAYISISICLILLLSISLLIKNEKYKDFFSLVLKGITMILLASLLYYIGLKLSFLITNISLSDGYNSINQLNNITFQKLPSLVFNAYQIFIRSFTIVSSYSNNSNIFYLVMISFLVMACCLLLFNRKKNFNSLNYILIIGIIIIYPLFANISGILSNGTLHYLMTYSCYLMLILPIIIFETQSNKSNIKRNNIIKVIICIIITFFLYKNIEYTNTLSLRKYFNDRITYATLTRIISDLEDIEEYEFNKTPILFIGNLNSSANFSNTEILKEYYATGFSNVFTVTYEDTYKNFLFYNLAYPFVNIDLAQAQNKIPRLNSYIDNMPIFPKREYIQYINGIIIIKLS